MEQEITFNKEYIENFDAWIKDINKKVEDLQDLKATVVEYIDNIQHNYELIYELKDEIEELKQEVNAIKLVQIISLKQEQQRTMKDEKCL